MRAAIGDPVNPMTFASRPSNCPKCNGQSAVDRYRLGQLIRDHEGDLVSIGRSDAEALIVKCQSCGFERAMEVAS